MKYTSLILIGTLMTLGGCKNDSASGNDSATTSVTQADNEIVAIVDSLPNGRWFYNPLHCTNELPVMGPYDFTVNENDLTYIGITDSGKWQSDKSNADAINSFKEFLAGKADCLKTDINEFVMMRYVGKTTEYSFAYSASHKLMLRYVDGHTELIVPFDVEAIKKLAIVDNTEESLPDESGV